MKLALGTVQFGLKYGINNRTGKPDLRQIQETIKIAIDCGIGVLDTAADYGDSERQLGVALAANSDFKIVTKVSQNAAPPVSLSNSLMRLNRHCVYGLLLHSFQQYQKSPSVWEDLVRLKREGLTEKVGFSLYLPEELELILELGLDIDIVQLPYSVFDQRFEQYFEVLKQRKVEVHVRSVFVQGLVFRDPHALEPFFYPISHKIQKLNAISNESRKSIESLCLNFVNANAFIDSIVVGVDSAENLLRNVAALEQNLSDEEYAELKGLKEGNEQMILPYNWKFR